MIDETIMKVFKINNDDKIGINRTKDSLVIGFDNSWAAIYFNVKNNEYRDKLIYAFENIIDKLKEYDEEDKNEID